MRKFRTRFLKGEDLSDILASIGSSRVTGTKDAKVALLAGSPLSEASLLKRLTNRVLEDVLLRLRLRTAGSKHERIERLLEYLRIAPAFSLGLTNVPATSVTARAPTPETTTGMSTSSVGAVLASGIESGAVPPSSSVAE